MWIFNAWNSEVKQKIYFHAITMECSMASNQGTRFVQAIDRSIDWINKFDIEIFVSCAKRKNEKRNEEKKRYETALTIFQLENFFQVCYLSFVSFIILSWVNFSLSFSMRSYFFYSFKNVWFTSSKFDLHTYW